MFDPTLGAGTDGAALSVPRSRRTLCTVREFAFDARGRHVYVTVAVLTRRRWAYFVERGVFDPAAYSVVEVGPVVVAVKVSDRAARW